MRIYARRRAWTHSRRIIVRTHKLVAIIAFFHIANIYHKSTNKMSFNESVFYNITGDELELKVDEGDDSSSLVPKRKYLNIKDTWLKTHPNEDYTEMVLRYAKQSWVEEDADNRTEADFVIARASPENMNHFRSSQEWIDAMALFKLADEENKSKVAEFKVNHPELWSQEIIARAARRAEKVRKIAERNALSMTKRSKKKSREVDVDSDVEVKSGKKKPVQPSDNLAAFYPIQKRFRAEMEKFFEDCIEALSK